jgi:hypothetical protein
MPAPTRARLAAIGLQGLDPTKKYVEVGKDGLLKAKEPALTSTPAVVLEEKKPLPVVEEKVEPVTPVLQEPLASVTSEVVTSPVTIEEAVEPVVEKVIQEEPVVVPAPLTEIEEKKDNKFFKKQPKKPSAV